MNLLKINQKINPIVSISNFLSNSEINQIFQLCEKKEFVDGSVGKDLDEKKYNFLKDYKVINPNHGKVKRIRQSSVKWISADDDSKWLFEKIIKCINYVNVDNYGYVLKFVDDFQFTKYTSECEGFYSKHVDCGDKYEIENFLDIRKLSFSIQLSDSDEYEGGELKFYNNKKSLYTNEEEYDIAKKDKGTIIFFPSHILHEVTPVTKGTRHSLVSWVLGPNII